MKKVSVLVGLVLVVALLACCAENGRDKLAGSWQSGSDRVTFSKDGKIQLVSGPATINSSYDLGGKRNLQVDLGIFGTTTLKYTVHRDELTLKDHKGKEVKYFRVKEESKPAAMQEEMKVPVQEQKKAPMKEEGKASPEHADSWEAVVHVRTFVG